MVEVEEEALLSFQREMKEWAGRNVEHNYYG